MATELKRTPDPLRIYYDRWKALDGLITELIGTYGPPQDFPRQATILHLLQELQQFSRGQFQFFYFGFEPGYPKRLETDPKLQRWDEFPAEDVLRGILDQIGHDLEVIQRAADQRVLGRTLVRTALDNADKLAWLALQPAMQYELVNKPSAVLTYFEKSAEFYNIPYGSVAVIGIPYTCVSTTNHRDYLAIPHEAGHYVYRHLQGKAKEEKDKAFETLQAPDSKVPAEYRHWVKAMFEEMCADIYAGLIGGPVMALDFESLSLANSRPDFCGSDGAHPNAAFRPLVYCRVLGSPGVEKLTDGDWRPMAEELSKRWDDQLLKRHVGDFVVKTSQINGQDELIKPNTLSINVAFSSTKATNAEADAVPMALVVDQVVTSIISGVDAYLTATNQPNEPHDLKGWAGEIPSGTDPIALFDAYESNFQDLVAQTISLPEAPALSADAVPGSQTSAHTTAEWLAWLKAKNPSLKENWPPEEEIPSGEVRDSEKMKKGTWGYILAAEGWTTSGPQDNNVHHFE